MNPKVVNHKSTHPRFVDLTGRTFGRLTAIRPVKIKGHRTIRWLCQCSCEKGKETIVRSWGLIGGGTRSCGCLATEGKRQRGLQRWGKLPPGTGKFGEASPQHKLTDAQVRQIFHLRKEGFSKTKIGKIVGCSQPNVSDILSGKRWPHIYAEFNPQVK